MVCRGWPVGTCFASLDAGMDVLVGFVGEAVQLAFPEGRLAGVIVVGPVRRPPERRYSTPLFAPQYGGPFRASHRGSH